VATSEPREIPRIDRVIVLGGGSAGVLAAMTLRKVVPDLPVTLIRSKDIGIIGVGEGTTVAVPNFLHGFLGLDPADFLRAARPTYKLGIRFLWGPRPYFNYTFSPQFDLRYTALSKDCGFYCYDPEAAADASDVGYAALNSALMSEGKAFIRLKNGAPGVRNDVAYHIENADFVRFLETQAARFGVEVVDDTVLNVEQDERGIAAVNCQASGRQAAGLFVDCSGFYSVLLSKALAEPFISFKPSLFCDRAVVGGWARGPEEPVLPYTTAETMDAGWCWQIEHENRINRGYVYSSAFISDDEAEREFRQKNAKVEATRVVKFISGRYVRGWVKNVVAIGNSSGFVEPLESTSLAAICNECHALATSLSDSDRAPGPAMASIYNRRTGQIWDEIRRFLAVHYKYNTRLDTPFWRAARADTDLAGAEPYAEYYAENGPSVIWGKALVGGEDVFGLEGYLAMMVGQRVPHRRPFKPTDRERQLWKQIRDASRAEAAGGLTVTQSLAVMRSPQWRSTPGFYRYPH
jgi:tryptophan halogenase